MPLARSIARRRSFAPAWRGSCGTRRGTRHRGTAGLTAGDFRKYVNGAAEVPWAHAAGRFDIRAMAVMLGGLWVGRIALRRAGIVRRHLRQGQRQGADQDAPSLLQSDTLAGSPAA